MNHFYSITFMILANFSEIWRILFSDHEAEDVMASWASVVI